MAAWFGGADEKQPDVGIWVSRFVDGKWTQSVEVANGIQHTLADGRVAMLWLGGNDAGVHELIVAAAASVQRLEHATRREADDCKRLRDVGRRVVVRLRDKVGPRNIAGGRAHECRPRLL